MGKMTKTSFLKFITESRGPHKFYHTSSFDNLASILKKGLIPGFEKPSGQDWLGNHHGKGIYLHTSLPHHELVNGCDDSGEVLLVVFEIEKIFDPKSFLPDEDTGLSMDEKGAEKAFNSSGAVAFIGKIQPQEIKSIYVPMKNEISEESLHEQSDIVYKFLDRGGKVYRYNVHTEEIE